MSTKSSFSILFLSNLPFTTSNAHPFPQFRSKLPFPRKRTQLPLKTHQIPNCLNPADPSPPSPPQPQQQPDHQLKDTQEAISLFLQGFGVSAAESDSIALNCPGYAKKLLEGVKELEELTAFDTGFGDLGFKEKVVSMAKQRGDEGKVAFLESVGLSFFSAMNVARYLSRESLPGLIRKVNYMKKMLFSGSDDKGIIGRYARRMMMQLSISIDDDLQQTLSFFEKIEARRGGLRMLGSSDAFFGYFVESFPRILLLPTDSHLEPMVKYLQSIGVPKDRVRCIFLLFPPILTTGIKEINRKLLFYENVGAVDKDFGKMLLKYPWILSKSIQENYKEILSFFEMEKVPKTSIDRAITSWPPLLGCSTGKLEVMVEQFDELGVRNKKLSHVIATCPQLLLRKPEEFFQVVLFLEDIGFEQETVGQILARCPEIFAASIEKTLKRKIEFLADIGVSEDHLPRVIRKYPEVLVSDINKALLPRLQYLMDIGLSKEEIASMVRRFSPLLGYSIDKVLRPKYELLVNTMKRPVEELVGYPRYFSYSIEKKIKPRMWVLKRKNIHCSLQDMLSKNDEAFASEFMDPGEMLVPPPPNMRQSN
ncbi:hypothetical protein Tsubulata_012204 [Turnera subulata]|uniref:Uncharacterized protein n=1 Tax=Turnera subulata TaxID=218843 RepID=A0A9Q0J968_9ROSI|nr:hypothetical protein Tsubulata_012204 [Turnera subulata]